MKLNEIHITLFISISAIGISLLTLYLSVFEPSKIRVFTGEKADIWRDDDNTSNISLQINISNLGAELGVIEKIALLVRGPKRKEPYLVELNYFSNSNLKTRPKSIMLLGHENTSNRFTFSELDEIWKEGEGLYKFMILIWENNYDPPIKGDSFSIVFSKSDIDKFRNFQSKTYVISKWGNWNRGYIKDPKIISILPNY